MTAPATQPPAGPAAHTAGLATVSADPVRDALIALSHSVCSAAAYPNTSVEQRWLRDRWLAALAALGLTEGQAQAECRAAMRGIYRADRPAAPARGAEGEGDGL